MMTPDLAEGSTTRQMVCQWVAPSAYEASRNSFGTESMASSAMLIMVGNAMYASINEPVRAVNPVGAPR